MSEAEREKLLLQLEGEKQQYVKVFESFSRIKPERSGWKLRCRSCRVDWIRRRMNS